MSSICIVQYLSMTDNETIYRLSKGENKKGITFRFAKIISQHIYVCIVSVTIQHLDLIQWSPWFFTIRHILIRILGLATFDILISKKCDLYKAFVGARQGS